MGRYTSSLAVGHETDLCRARRVSILELLLRVGMYTTAAVLAGCNCLTDLSSRDGQSRATAPYNII